MGLLGVDVDAYRGEGFGFLRNWEFRLVWIGMDFLHGGSLFFSFGGWLKLIFITPWLG
jgi:hypothetical protein